MDDYEFRFHVNFYEKLSDPVIAYIVKDVQGMDVTGTNTLFHHVETGDFEPGDVLQVSFTHKMTLSGGGYILSCGCAGYEKGEYVVYERRYDVLAFEVAARIPCVGVFDLDSTITLTCDKKSFTPQVTELEKNAG